MDIKPLQLKDIEGLEVESVVDTIGGHIIHFSDGVTAFAPSLIIVQGKAAAAPAKPAPVAEKPAAPAPAAKPAAAPAKPAAKKGTDWDDLLDMDKEELIDFIEDEELGIKTKGLDEEDLREAIAAKMKIEIPADDDDDAPEPEEDVMQDITWEDLKAADYTDLCDVVTDYKIEGIDVDDYDDDTLKGFRKAIAKKLGIEVPAK